MKKQNKTEAPTPDTLNAEGVPLWKAAVDMARAEADALYQGKGHARGREQLDDARAQLFDLKLREACTKAGRSDLLAAWHPRARLVGGEFVVVPVSVPATVERMAYDNSNPHAFVHWTAAREFVLPVDSALALLVNPVGPTAELARRHGILAEEQRQHRIEAEKKAAADAAAAEQARLLKERDDDFARVSDVHELLHAAVTLAPGSAGRQVLIALATERIAARCPQARYAPPKLDDELEQVMRGLAGVVIEAKATAARTAEAREMRLQAIA